MVPNPIYSGSPIYEEIVDAKNLKSLTKGHVEGGWRDEGYVEISADAVEKMVSTFPIPEENKLVGDKYATISVSTLTEYIIIYYTCNSVNAKHVCGYVNFVFNSRFNHTSGMTDYLCVHTSNSKVSYNNETC